MLSFKDIEQAQIPSQHSVHVKLTLGSGILRGLRRGASKSKGKLGLLGHVKALGSDRSQTSKKNNVLPLSFIVSSS